MNTQKVFTTPLKRACRDVLNFPGTVDHNATSKTLAIKYARQADKAALFNYASMAHNNHFFFSGLVRLSSHGLS